MDKGTQAIRIAKRLDVLFFILLSDKNESYYFHTSWSTNKQGSGNLDRKTSPLIIKRCGKRNICEKSQVSFGRSGPRRNPRWSERSEWNLGYESQRIIAHRRCRLTPTREKKHRGRWYASSKLPCHYASPPHVCCATRGVPTRAASLMLTGNNCYRLSEQFARLIHVRNIPTHRLTYFYRTAIIFMFNPYRLIP